MKKFKSLMMVMMLFGASAFIFSSCGSDESTDTEEEVKLDSGLGLVKQLANGIEKGDVTIDKSNTEVVAKYFGIENDDDSYLYESKDFEGYRVDLSYTINEEVFHSASYNSFYDEGKEEQAGKDSKEILDFLKEKLGETESDSEKYFSWNKENYSVSFNLFDDGWSLSYTSETEIDYNADADGEYDADCVGDFYGLKEDLASELLENMKNGSIKIGVTSETDMVSILGEGNSESYEVDFEGIRLSGYFTYEEGALASIRFDYFYDCEGAKTLLDSDKTGIKEKIEEVLGVTAETTGSGESEAHKWSFDSQSIEQTGFSDGYALAVGAE